MLFAGFQVTHHRTDQQIFLFKQTGDRHVVHRRSTQIENRLRKVYSQPRVVELTVIILHATLQARRLKRRNAPQCLLPGKDLRRAEAKFASQAIVDLHANPVERPLPPAVDRDDERKMMHQTRGVLAKQPAFAERLEDQRNVPLFQVTHPSVDQFRTAAGCSLGEIILLDQQRAVSAGRCVHRHTKARRRLRQSPENPRIFVFSIRSIAFSRSFRVSLHVQGSWLALPANLTSRRTAAT